LAQVTSEERHASLPGWAGGRDQVQEARTGLGSGVDDGDGGAGRHADIDGFGARRDDDAFDAEDRLSGGRFSGVRQASTGFLDKGVKIGDPFGWKSLANPIQGPS
jgi:hypothetical protein